MTIPRTIFLSRGTKGPAWYRCALPALALECEWACYDGHQPPDVRLHHGVTNRDLTFADLDSYDVIVVQQPRGVAWLRAIRAWQERGVVVLAEVDDWIRGIGKKADHDFAERFDRRAVEEHEMCLRVADGIICSTRWLADRYRALNPVTHACANGIDVKRYALTLPARDHVAVGWAGATGHGLAVKPWLREVAAVMREREELRFVSVGQRFADHLAGEFGERRCLNVPFAPLAVYPSAMTLFDVALAPAGDSNFYRGKSDLRWLESSALGIPLIADPVVYPEIEHGVTGFHAATAAEMAAILRELVADPGLRRSVGAAAKAHVTEHRNARVAALRWAEVLRSAAGTADRTAA